MKQASEMLRSAVKSGVQKMIRNEVEGWPPVCPSLWTYQPRRPEKMPTPDSETPAQTSAE